MSHCGSYRIDPYHVKSHKEDCETETEDKNVEFDACHVVVLNFFGNVVAWRGIVRWTVGVRFGWPFFSYPFVRFERSTHCRRERLRRQGTGST
jgi:hypothetical protein